jgi:ABC-type lipoprotein export system ATPase subunit
MVTHDENMAEHAGRIIRMRDGQVEQIEKVAQPRRSQLPDSIEKSLSEVSGALY